MTYDNDPPRLRLSGDSSDPFVQALDEAHFELPDAGQLKAVAASLPLFDDVNGGEASNRRGSFFIGRTRLRVKSAQAAAIALAIAFGVGATVLLRESVPFMGHSDVPPAVPTEEAGPRPAVVQLRPVAPLPKVEEAPAEISLRPAPPHAAPSAPRRTPVSPAEERPNQADLPASDVDGPSPEAETALLGRAHQALGSDPARALALTNEHRRVYHAGALGKESDLIAIEALAALGRTGEARASAARFRARYQSSAYLRRLDRLLGEGDGVSPSSSGH